MPEILDEPIGLVKAKKKLPKPFVLNMTLIAIAYVIWYLFRSNLEMEIDRFIRTWAMKDDFFGQAVIRSIYLTILLPIFLLIWYCFFYFSKGWNVKEIWKNQTAKNPLIGHELIVRVVIGLLMYFILSGCMFLFLNLFFNSMNNYYLMTPFELEIVSDTTLITMMLFYCRFGYKEFSKQNDTRVR